MNDDLLWLSEKGVICDIREDAKHYVLSSSEEDEIEEVNQYESDSMVCDTNDVLHSDDTFDDIVNSDDEAAGDDISSISESSELERIEIPVKRGPGKTPRCLFVDLTTDEEEPPKKLIWKKDYDVLSPYRKSQFTLYRLKAKVGSLFHLQIIVAHGIHPDDIRYHKNFLGLREVLHQHAMYPNAMVGLTPNKHFFSPPSRLSLVMELANKKHKAYRANKNKRRFCHYHYCPHVGYYVPSDQSHMIVGMWSYDQLSELKQIHPEQNRRHDCWPLANPHLSDFIS